jgi:hypothetical protein
MSCEDCTDSFRISLKLTIAVATVADDKNIQRRAPSHCDCSKGHLPETNREIVNLLNHIVLPASCHTACKNPLSEIYFESRKTHYMDTGTLK